MLWINDHTHVMMMLPSKVVQLLHIKINNCWHRGNFIFMGMEINMARVNHTIDVSGLHWQTNRDTHT